MQRSFEAALNVGERPIRALQVYQAPAVKSELQFLL